MITKFISIKAVLYNISLLIDDKYWNETKVLEWAVRGLRQLGIMQNYVQSAQIFEVTDNKVILPKELQSVLQVFYTEQKEISSSNLNLPPNSNLTSKLREDINTPLWKPMKRDNLSVNLNTLDERYVNRDCAHSYAISTENILTTTLSNGYIGVTYLQYPVDKDNIPLMPDDETVKEALTHFVLYYYWMSKYMMKEEGAEQRIKFHLEMWQTLSMKSKNLNAPDLTTLEKLRVEHTNIIPKSNHFQELFLNFGKE